MIKLGATVEDRDVLKAMSEARKRGQDMTPAWEAVGETMRTSVVRNYEEGGRPEAWKESMRVKEKGGKTLIDSGRLIGSINSMAFADRSETGTNVEYAAIQHAGGTIPPHKVVAREGGALRIPTSGGVIFRKSANIPEVTIEPRPFLLVQDEDWPVIEGHIMDHSTEGLNA